MQFVKLLEDLNLTQINATNHQSTQLFKDESIEKERRIGSLNTIFFIIASLFMYYINIGKS